MEDATLNPAMGNYLDMANNVKPAPGAHANENYAREFTQLFSIGPNVLNPDGTPVLSPTTGAFVPPYTQTDLQELAVAFAGWTYPNETPGQCNGPYGNGGSHMVACDINHDMSAKT